MSQKVRHPHVRLRNPVFGLRLAFEQAVPFETV
jgi:hypothetical protein